MCAEFSVRRAVQILAAQVPPQHTFSACLLRVHPIPVTRFGWRPSLYRPWGGKGGVFPDPARTFILISQISDELVELAGLRIAVHNAPITDDVQTEPKINEPEQGAGRPDGAVLKEGPVE